MGNSLFGGAEEEEEQEQAELLRWRPAAEGQNLIALKKKKLSSRSSASSDDGASGASESQSLSSSASRLDDGSSAGDEDSLAEEKSEKSEKSEEESGSEEDDDADDALQKRDEAKRSKRVVVRMEFEPLLSLHEPLAVTMDEPSALFAQQTRRKSTRAEQQALESAMAISRQRAQAAAEHMMEMGLEEIELSDIVTVLGEDPDELRYALEQSMRFTVDAEGIVSKRLFQQILDVMESDIETLQEILQKLEERDIVTDEAAVKECIKESWGELRLKVANEIALIEHVDVEAEQRMRRDQEKEERQKAKEDKLRAKKRSKKALEIQDEEESSSSDEEGGALASHNKETEQKALMFRRVQVQRRIEDFLKTYTRGMNLTKINAKGKRYHRRVYVDTMRKALVIQGASGPKFYPFMSMKEVDIETRTTKEGRVETLVICAIEKGGRIVKELNLSFPDQAKANTFVNCVTLFSLALRSEKQRK